MAISQERREYMCRLCKDPRRRNSEWSRERPTRWQPTSIENPDTGLCFTPISAWHYIADLLESEHEFKEMKLRKPPGATAYEAWVRLSNGKVIYLKVQPSGDKIFGRSFHYDQPPE